MPSHAYAIARRFSARGRTAWSACLIVIAGCLCVMGGRFSDATDDDSPASAATLLSAEQAGALVSRSQGAIALDSLTRLSPEAALQLAAHPGGLSLDGLTSVDSALARVLSMHGRLAGVDCGLIDADEILQKLDGLFAAGGDATINVQSLLDGIESLLADLPRQAAAEDADAAPGEGDPWLSLGGLKTIPSAIASVLATHDGPLLLDGLTEVSPEVARALAKHSGELSLAGLTSLSGDARTALTAHDGPVVLPDALVTATGGG